ncbi:hypothetical protein CMT69_01605 [Elizabethkingia anophelis]|nr:hypothetical protein [Elizabethkingia anophelis]QGN24625.1 hypothetical protein GJV56_18910 [Elizabethkingia anophelis]QNV11263.1 hypothetical protein EIY88_18850 [Elizabethkingia anophelis]
MVAKNIMWKQVLNHPEYMVSNTGDVKSVDRIGFNKGINAYCLLKGKNIKSCIASNGYSVVNIKSKTNYVHRLVYEAFNGEIEDGMTINHINGNKQDNSISNLEKVTYSENHLHAFNTLKRKPNPLGRFGKYHNVSKAVDQFDLNGNLIESFECARDAYRKRGFSYREISACINGKRKTHSGFIWKLNQSVNQENTLKNL